MMKTAPILLLFLLSTSASAQSPSLTIEESKARFEALKAEFRQGYLRFTKDLSGAESEEKQERVQARRHEECVAYVAALLALARKAPANPYGLRSVLEILDLTVSDSRHKKAAREALPLGLKVVGDAALQRRLARRVASLRFALDRSTCLQALEALSAKSRPLEVREQAQLSWLSLVCEGDLAGSDRLRARSLATGLAKTASTPQFRTRARALEFDIENLRLGMKLPDRHFVDEDGSKRKLRGFRDRVVLIVFWGFW